MKKIWHIGRLDLKLMVKDKAFFFWVLLFPLAFILIFGNLYQGSKTDTKASLTVLTLSAKMIPAFRRFRSPLCSKGLPGRRGAASRPESTKASGGQIPW
jgi:hypothetical protein